MQKADIFVLSSDHEGFPNVLLEAMAARLPVVTTSAGDAGLIVRNGINGYVVASGDIAGMSNYIVRLSRSPELRLQMGETGKRYVKKQYDSRQLTKGLFQIYYDIAKRTHKPIPAITGYLFSMNEAQV